MCNEYNELSNSELRSNFNNDIWVTEQYTTIPLIDMTDTHLSNAIEFIVYEGVNSCYGYGGKWFPKLLAERLKRNCTCGK